MTAEIDENGVAWLTHAPWPGHVGLVPDKKAWRRTCTGLLGAKGGKYLNGAEARCTTFEKDGSLLILVSLDWERAAAASWAVTVGTLVHELTHALDFLLEEAGESSPGMETRAYGLQMMVMDAYEPARKLWKKARREAKKAEQ